MPKISIIMGAYNCQNTVCQSIDSILAQTFNDWEFIICDDASTDNTLSILNQYKAKYPDKFIILQNSTNMGLSASLNKCLENAKGEFIARMDADDISLPDRFEKQINFLINNSEVNLVSTAMQHFDDSGIHDIVLPVQNPNKYTLRNSVPFFHATIMTYKSVYDKLNGYTVSERTKRAQDYDLWFRFYHAGFVGQNLNEVLYLVREDKNAIRRRTVKSRINAFKTTCIGFKLLNFPRYWIIKPFFLMIFKSLIPFFVIDLYKQYQRKRK